MYFNKDLVVIFMVPMALYVLCVHLFVERYLLFAVTQHENPSGP